MKLGSIVSQDEAINPPALKKSPSLDRFVPVRPTLGEKVDGTLGVPGCCSLALSSGLAT